MARINIEECWWSDPRRDKLGKIIGNPDLTESVIVRAWRLAQEYWGKGQLIPGNHFLTTLHSDALLLSGLARVHLQSTPNSDIILMPSSLRFIERISNDRSTASNEIRTDLERFLTEAERNYIYVNGSSDLFKWHKDFREQRVEAGKKSAQKRRLKDGTAQPKKKKTERISNDRSEVVERDRTLVQKIEHSGSGSGSDSVSDSSSGSPGVTSGSEDPAPDLNRMVWDKYKELVIGKFNTEPVRNARVNGQVAQFTKRIPDKDLIPLLEFYFKSTHDYYVKNCFDIGLLLADAEKLYLQMKSGVKITDTRNGQLPNGKYLTPEQKRMHNSDLAGMEFLDEMSQLRGKGN